MDPMLQRHCAKYIYVVPDGLRELMSDISREVLRSQPEQLYTFIADYLDALMITRENARVAAKLIEVITEIAETVVEFLVRTGMTRDEADRIVAKIQAAFRSHLARKKHLKLVQESEEEEQEFLESVMEEIDVEHMYLDAAARIIQKAYREFKEREARERDLLRGMVDWRVAARATIQLYRRTGVTYAEANRAATLIKAAYKGYYTRRLMRKLLERGAKEYLEYLPEDEHPAEELGEDDDWGWCYCFMDDAPSSHTHATAYTGYETTEFEGSEDSSVLISDVLTSILLSVIPSEEDLPKPEEEAPEHVETAVEKESGPNELEGAPGHTEETDPAPSEAQDAENVTETVGDKQETAAIEEPHNEEPLHEEPHHEEHREEPHHEEPHHEEPHPEEPATAVEENKEAPLEAAETEPEQPTGV